MPAIDAAAIGAALVRTLAHGLPIVAVAWLAGQLLPWLTPRVTAALWWIAALKLVVSLAPVPGIVVPLLPAVQPASPQTTNVSAVEVPYHAAAPVPRDAALRAVTPEPRVGLLESPAARLCGGV